MRLLTLDAEHTQQTLLETPFTERNAEVAPDGRWLAYESIYVAPDGSLMSVRVERSATWAAGNPSKVLEGKYFTGAGGLFGRSYDISPDGKRFLMIKPTGSDLVVTPTNIVVVQNFFEELKRLVPRN